MLRPAPARPSSLPAFSRQQRPGDRPVLGAGVELAAITLMVVAHIAHVSGILDVVSPAVTQIAFVVQYLMFALYGYVALMRGQWKIVAVALAFVAYLIWQAYHFQTISGQAMNVNAALTFGTLLMAVPLFQTRLPLGTVLRIVLFCAIGYLLLYIALAPLIMSGAVETRITLTDDGTRGVRALLSGQFAAFVLFAGIVLTRRSAWQGLLLIAIAGYAIFIAQSRVFQAVLAVTGAVAIIGTIFPFTRRPITVVLAIAFLTIAAANLWGYVDPSWNPYQVMAQDASGQARYIEYGDALQAIRSHYLTGIGIPPSQEGLELYVRPRRPFFPSDLGPAGIFFQFGLIGTVLFLVASVGCILSLPSPAIRPSPLSFALHYTALHAALYGFFAPVLFGGSGTLFAAFTFALWMKGGYFRVSRAGFVARPSEIDPNAYGADIGRAAPGRS